MTHAKTNTKTKINTKCFKDLMNVISFKSRGFKDFNMNVVDVDMVEMDIRGHGGYGGH